MPNRVLRSVFLDHPFDNFIQEVAANERASPQDVLLRLLKRGMEVDLGKQLVQQQAPTTSTLRKAKAAGLLPGARREAAKLRAHTKTT